MTAQQLLEKGKTQKIGKEPVVVVPLKDWRNIEARLEEFEMTTSPSFKKKISKARSETKLYSSKDVKKLLGF